MTRPTGTISIAQFVDSSFGQFFAEFGFIVVDSRQQGKPFVSIGNYQLSPARERLATDHDYLRMYRAQ